MAEELAVLPAGVAQVHQGLAGNHQHMHRRLGIDIAESQAEVVGIDRIAGNLTPQDAAENRVVRRSSASVADRISCREVRRIDRELVDGRGIRGRGGVGGHGLKVAHRGLGRRGGDRRWNWSGELRNGCVGQQVDGEADGRRDQCWGVGWRGGSTGIALAQRFGSASPRGQSPDG